MPDKIRVTPNHTDVKIYFIKPDRKLEFLNFYRSNIISWLTGQNVNLANVWAVDRRECLALIVALDRDDTDWYDIAGIDQYVDGPVRTPIMARPELDIP